MEIIERTRAEKERPGTEDRVPEQDPVKLYVPHRKKLHTVRDPQAPVGVFDSGVGGLTVAREIMRLISITLLSCQMASAISLVEASSGAGIRCSRALNTLLRASGR